MLKELGPSHGVMEGEGFSNQHAKLPADGAATALPLLEKAIREVTLDSDDGPIVIADYGSSQGKNSQVPMKVAVKGLRAHVSTSRRPISVYHIDQPTNDFNSLFKVLDADPDRYVALINRRDHWLGIRQHLSQSISVDDLHICQVTEDFQDTPLFLSRLIAESLIRQARNRSCNLFRTLLSGVEVFLKLCFSQA